MSGAMQPTPNPAAEPISAAFGSRRRYYITAAGVIAAAAVAGLTTIYALRIAPGAESDAETVQVADRMWDEADLIEHSDPERSLRLRSAALDLDPADWRRIDLARMLIAPSPLSIATAHSERIKTLAVSPDGQMLLVGGQPTAELWNIEDRSDPTRIVDFPSDVVEVTSATFTPDSARLLINGAGQFSIWDVEDPAQPRQIAALTEPPRRLGGSAISNDGRYAIIGVGQSAMIWDISRPSEPQPLATIPASDTVEAVAFHPDGTIAAVGQWGRNGNLVALWDITAPTSPTLLAAVYLAGYVGEIAISADGQLLLAGNENRADIWDISDVMQPQHAATLGWHTGQVHDVALSPDGRYAMTVASDSAHLWDVTHPTRPVYIASLADNAVVVSSGLFTPDGNMVITAGWGGTVNLWHTPTQLLLRNADLLPVLAGGVRLDSIDQHAIGNYGYEISTNRDGTRTAIAYIGGPITILDTAAPHAVEKLSHLNSSQRPAVISADGTKLLAGDPDNGAGLWDLTDATRPARLATLPIGGALTAAAISVDGALAVTGARDGTATLWDISTPTEPRELASLPDNGEVPDVALSADANMLLVASTYGEVSHWDINDPTRPQLIRILSGHIGGAHAATFNVDGTIAITSDAHGAVMLWDLQSTTASAEPNTTFDLGDESLIFDLDIISTGVALMGNLGKPGELWLVADRASPMRLTALPIYEAGSSNTTWSDQGRTAIVLNEVTKTVSIWSLDSLHDVLADPVRRACSLAAGGLTEDEWPPYAGDVGFRKTCQEPVAPPTGPAVPIVGSWHVHGTRLDINADLTGIMTWNAGPCWLGLDPGIPLCTGKATVAFAATSDGLAGTIVEVTYVTEDGQPFDASDAQPGGRQVGDTLTLQVIDFDVLQVTADPPERQGRAYYCGPLATETWRNRCNV